jgi:PKHD-type hydroxylase
MQVFIENLLDNHQLNAIVEALDDEALFESGEKTAGATAKQVKQNQQANSDALEVKGASALVKKALLANSVLNAAAIPKTFAKIMFNRYQDGEYYGFHVDNPMIAKVRTDLSFTLFLSEPGSYQGGELIIRGQSCDQAIKLPKGSLALYPSSSLHAVNPVTEGTRLAAVGWVQSRVKQSEHRELLFDIENTLSQLPQNKENTEARLSLIKVRSNLARLWLD